MYQTGTHAVMLIQEFNTQAGDVNIGGNLRTIDAIDIAGGSLTLTCGLVSGAELQEITTASTLEIGDGANLNLLAGSTSSPSSVEVSGNVTFLNGSGFSTPVWGVENAADVLDVSGAISANGAVCLVTIQDGMIPQEAFAIMNCAGGWSGSGFTTCVDDDNPPDIFQQQWDSNPQNPNQVTYFLT